MNTWISNVITTYGQINWELRLHRRLSFKLDPNTQQANNSQRHHDKVDHKHVSNRPNFGPLWRKCNNRWSCRSERRCFWGRCGWFWFGLNGIWTANPAVYSSRRKWACTRRGTWWERTAYRHATSQCCGRIRRNRFQAVATRWSIR